MGFFGMVISPEKNEAIEVPPGWCLQLCTAALEPAKKGVKPRDNSSTLWVQVEGEIGGTSYLIGSLQGGGVCAQIPVRHCLTSIDGEVVVEVRGTGTVHLTGFFNREYDSDLEQDDSSESSEEDEESSDERPEDQAIRATRKGVTAEGDESDSDEDQDMEEDQADVTRAASSRTVRRGSMRSAAAAAAKACGTGGGEDDSEDDSEVDGEYLPEEDEDAEEEGDNEYDDEDEYEEEEDMPVARNGGKSGKAAGSKRAASAAASGGASAASGKRTRSHEEQEEAATAPAEVSEQSKQDRKKQRRKENKKKAADSKRALEEAFSGMAADDKEPPVGIPLKNPPTKTLKGGLKIKDTVLGDGKAAMPGKNVKICYEGCFPNGKIFDKNQSRKRPLQFRVGMKQVIVGMDRGVEGMRVGGSREISIPAALAYGARGTGPIPANQDLIFRVEMVDVLGK